MKFVLEKIGLPRCFWDNRGFPFVKHVYDLLVCGAQREKGAACTERLNRQVQH